MKHFILLFVLLLATVSGAKAAPLGLGMGERRQALRNDSALSLSTANIRFTTHQPLAIARTQSRAATGSVTFSLKNDSDYAIKAAVAINPSTGECVYYEKQKNVFKKAEIPCGTYDFLFWGERQDTDYWYQCLLSEPVTITAETSYAIDFSKCTGFAKFESTFPDGKRALLPMVNLDTKEVVEPGNLAQGLIDFYLFMDGTLIDWTYTLMDKGIYNDGWTFDNEESMNVYVNPEAKNLAVVQYRGLIGDSDHKGIYYSACVANPLQAGTYKSQPYACHHAPVKITNATTASFAPRPGLFYRTFYKDRVISTMSVSNKEILWPLGDDWYVGSEDALSPLGLNFFPSPAVIGGVGASYSSSDGDALGVICNPIVNVNGKVVSLAIPNALDGISTTDMYNSYSNWQGLRKWANNEWFNVNEGGSLIADGNSAPIFVGEHLWYTSDYAKQYGMRSVLYHNYRGRNGEGRTIDFLGEEVKATVNGKPIDLSSYKSIHSLKIGPDQRLGEWNINFVNNNVVVNGEKGFNKTTVHFNDTLDDVTAPTLQMLQTVNADGMVTDSFSNPQDAFIVLSGGDFEPRYAEDTQLEWFMCKPCDIKVELSPAGTDDWESISLAENESRFMVPGWGYYWVGDCSGLKSRSKTTTYAMRVTLTDASGNYQQQTLYPVLTIAFLGSGLTEINPDTDRGTVTYYNLQGLRIASPEAGQLYIERKGNGKASLKMAH